MKITTLKLNSTFIYPIIKPLFNSLFIFSFILFSIHQILQKKLGISFVWIDSYLDDILFMPIVLNLLLVERRLYYTSNETYKFSKLDYIIITIFLGIVIEIGFPMISNAFTFDYYDFLAYAVGTMIYIAYNKD